MSLRSPALTAGHVEPQHRPSHDRSRNSPLRSLVTATAIGCFALLQGENHEQKNTIEPAGATATLLQESVCLDQVSPGESLLNTLLCITTETPEGKREILFRIVRDRDELVLCLENGVFRSGNSIVGIGKVSKQISDVTAQEDSIRLHTAGYGHAEIRQGVVADVIQSLAAVPQSQQRLQVLADATYVPAEGSTIQMAHTLFQSVEGMFGGEQTSGEYAESTHKVTFQRDQPVRIAHNDR